MIILQSERQTTVEISRLGRKPDLPVHIENDLVKYCTVMDQKYFGLSRRDLKKLAFQLAVRNNISSFRFSRDKQSAGKKWLRNFLIRHPQLSFRCPQLISIARAQGFTKENVDAFFQILKPELDKVGHRSNRVFNVDETGITTVQHKSSKVLNNSFFTFVKIN